MKKLHGLVAAAGMLSASVAMATPISGTSLQTTIAGMGGVIDVQNDQYAYDQRWRMGATGMSPTRIQFELGAYADEISFGIYDFLNPTTQLTIFSGADGVGTPKVLTNFSLGSFCVWDFSSGSTCAAFNTNQFGFFLTTPTGDTYYSENYLNADGVDHMVAYDGGSTRGSLNGSPWTAGEFLLAWEDVYGGGDGDYEDFGVLVESVVGVPEPTGIAVFGAGLLALGIATRRSVLRARTRRS